MCLSNEIFKKNRSYKKKIVNRPVLYTRHYGISFSYCNYFVYICINIMYGMVDIQCYIAQNVRLKLKHTPRLDVHRVA